MSEKQGLVEGHADHVPSLLLLIPTILQRDRPFSRVVYYARCRGFDSQHFHNFKYGLERGPPNLVRTIS